MTTFKKHIFLLLLPTFFLAVSMEAFGQGSDFEHFNFESLSIEEGLSQNTVNTLLQDSKGFLWIGTQDGLNRYDAYEVKIYRHRKDDSTSLIDNHVETLLEDSHGNIWIGTHRGLSVFRKDFQDFKSYEHDPEDNTTLGGNFINCLEEDSNGFLWIGTRSGLDRFDPTTETFKHFTVDDKEVNTVTGSFIRELMEDQRGDIWVGTNRGLSLLDPVNQKFTHFEVSSTEVGTLSHSSIMSLYEDRFGAVWVGTSFGLNRYSPRSKVFERFMADPLDDTSLPNSSISDIGEDKDGNIWVAHSDGIGRFNRDSKTFTNFSFKTDDDEEHADTGSINELFTDKSGIMWVGTQNFGVLKYDISAKLFDTYNHDKNKLPGTLLDNNIWAVVKQVQHNNIWVGTREGLNVIDRDKDIYHSYQRNIDGEGPVGNNILSVIHLNEEWGALGTYGQGLSFFKKDIKTGLPYQFFNFVTVRGSGKVYANGNDITSFAYDEKENILYIGTFRGLTQVFLHDFNPENFEFIQYYEKKEKGGLKEDFIRCVRFTSDRTLWIGTDNGLFKCLFDSDKRIHRFVEYNTVKGDHHSLNHKTVASIWEDETGKLWVGTGGGLNHFDPKTGKSRNFLSKNFGNYGIFGILGDKSGNLWISTNNGLMRFSKETENFYQFNSEDGLQSNEFNSGSYSIAKNGEMFFGGIKGFNAFHPDSIKPYNFVPPVIITDFKLLNKSVPFRSSENPDSPLEKHISQTSELELSHKDNVISFEFVALNYRLTEKNRYSYMLEGEDKDWREPDSRRFATYSNLLPGYYTFKVRANNNDGKWSEVTTLKIYIKPPVWSTWWFRVIIVILVSVFIAVLYSWRIRAINNKKRLLESLVNARTAEVVDKNRALAAKKDELERSSANIQILSEIGHKITAILDVKTIVGVVYDYVTVLMEASAFGIGMLNNEENRIDFKGFIEEGKRHPDDYDSLEDDNCLSVWSLKNDAEVLINDFSKEHTNYIKNNIKVSLGGRMNSVMYLPLKVENDIVGVLTVQSEKKNAYSESDLTILRSLATYISVALTNAQAYTNLESANKTIRTKNKHIVDSIRYGKTIQQAILPDTLDSFFDDTFIMFKPKELVSGDFYWCNEVGGRVFTAVVDCTGHGVPGAFMSMIGNTLLNEIVERKGIREPNKILEELHKAVRVALHQDDGQNLDGMDICFCAFDKIAQDSGEYNYEVTFAGAKRPLLVVRRNRMELEKIRGSIKSIGGRQKEAVRTFQQEKLTLQKGDTLFMTTDGYSDQNNQKREKFGIVRMEEMLLSNVEYDLYKQRSLLVAQFNKHRGREEQRDDITIIGIKL